MRTELKFNLTPQPPLRFAERESEYSLTQCAEDRQLQITLHVVRAAHDV
jgi:hypothetical protein